MYIQFFINDLTKWQWGRGEGERKADSEIKQPKIKETWYHPWRSVLNTALILCLLCLFVATPTVEFCLVPIQIHLPQARAEQGQIPQVRA